MPMSVTFLCARINHTLTLHAIQINSIVACEASSHGNNAAEPN